MKKEIFCLVSSPGGHLSKLIRLKPWWNQHQRFWVTHLGSGQLYALKGEKIIPGCFPENRNLWNFLKNLLLAFKVIFQNKPTYIVSLGAGIAVPFFLVGKLFGCKLIFIETLVFAGKPTLSGRMLYRIADYFIVQHKDLLDVYPQATLKEWRI